MRDITIDKKYLRHTAYSAFGVQNKYFKDGYWYKENENGYEGKAEALVSVIMQHSNISDFIVYEECMINGKKGCVSKNFLNDGEDYITLQQLYAYAGGGKLSDRVYKYDQVRDRIEFVLDFIHERTSLDYRDYISKILSLDMLTLNPDRHFHNMGVIMAGDTFRTAPIFDNGAGLLSNYSVFPVYANLDENIEKVASAPFSGSLEQQAYAAGISLKLDYKVINTILDLHTDNTRATGILKMQLEKYKHVIRDLREEPLHTKEQYTKNVQEVTQSK